MIVVTRVPRFTFTHFTTGRPRARERGRARDKLRGVGRRGGLAHTLAARARADSGPKQRERVSYIQTMAGQWQLPFPFPFQQAPTPRPTYHPPPPTYLRPPTPLPSGLISATRYVATHHSPWVLLRGMDACIHREVKYCIGQFAAIGFVESALKRWSEANHETNSLALQLHENASLRILASSMSVGFMCTVISQPDDVVKTRMQSHLPPSRASSSSAAKGAASGATSDSAAERGYQKYRGYLASFRTVSAEEGVAALWRGWVWRCCVRVPLGLAVINMAHPHLRPHVAALLPNS